MIESVGEIHIEVKPDPRVLFSFGRDEPGHPIPDGPTRVGTSLVPDA